MIKLKELIGLNELTYNKGPSEKHQSRIDRIVTLFEDLEMPTMVYPENSSKETLEEIKYLSSIEENRDFVKKHDDVDKVFAELHKELGLQFDKSEAKRYLKESSKYIMELKYKYQRPRPYQIAEFYNIDLNGVDLDSMKTPSYPSGHATQGYLLGMIYSERYPEHRKDFMRLGEDIAQSRIIGKAHYPSDKKGGIDLAEKLFDNLK
jgi:hypothetical protein|tara:strand:- start:253 stop:870 length:618 start_codon:yes stop_codon:yes gene_type:complete